MSDKPRVAIHYCTQCKWMLRAAWMAQEILSSFAEEVAEVALVPAKSGTFQIFVNQVVVWDRKTDGGFPEAKVLKQKIRDQVAPDRDLGHCDITP